MADRTTQPLSGAMNDPSIFGEDYFMHGEEKKISGYSSYSWMPDQTLDMAIHMKRYLKMKEGSSIYEFGAARGYLVKALRMLSVESYGYDVSEWAVKNCDPSVSDYMTNVFNVQPMSYDYTVAKDVMEHLTKEQLQDVIPKLWAATRWSMLIIVPLAASDEGPYLCPRDEGDVTHKIRWTLGTWIKFLGDIDRRSVCCGSLYVPGIKQFNCNWEGSCGFFVLKRI